MSSRMEEWRLHIESMWTAHKRKWLNSWRSSEAELTWSTPFYSCGIDFASRRPLLARVPDHGEQCQQVTPAMLMGNFSVSEPRSLEEEQLQPQERTMYQRVILCCWKKKRSDWSLGFGQEGLSGKLRVVEVKVGNTIFFCTFCSLFVHDLFYTYILLAWEGVCCRWIYMFGFR